MVKHSTFTGSATSALALRRSCRKCLSGNSKEEALSQPRASNGIQLFAAYGSVAHRTLAAFLALSRRCSAVNLAARAGPPFLPPSRPKATAATWRSSGVGSGGDTIGGASSGSSPVARATVDAARWFKSRGRLAWLRERSAMLLD